MAMRRQRYERPLVLAIALHSVAVGLVLLFAPAWGLPLGGFDPGSASFFARQAGAFHLVAAGGYVLEHVLYDGVTFLVFTKTLAVVFLLSETARAGAPWSIPASALGDALMAAAVVAVRRAAVRPSSAPDAVDEGRRRAVHGVSLLVLLAPAAGLGAVSCASEDPGPAGARTLRVPLGPARRRGFAVVSDGTVPIEVRLTAEGWVARSLRCTHFGCTVRWSEDLGRYECPCHAGAFDATGRPIAGPPVAPLPSFPVRREGGVLVVTVT